MDDMALDCRARPNLNACGRLLLQPNACIATACIREQGHAPTKAQHGDDKQPLPMPLATQGTMPQRFYNESI